MDMISSHKPHHDHLPVHPLKSPEIPQMIMPNVNDRNTNDANRKRNLQAVEQPRQNITPELVCAESK